MDEQGGAGGMPLHHERSHSKPGTDGHEEGKTAAADTDEASRLDRPEQPEARRGKGTRWVSPRDE